MIYLTDHPGNTLSFLPTGMDWTETTPLNEMEEMCWPLYSPSPTMWRAITPDGGPRLVVLIDHSPESQFDVTLQALKEGRNLPDGLVCLALEGTRFRGQRHRPWTALRGNLHLTTHVLLNAPAKQLENGLSLLPVVAAAQAIYEASGGRAQPGIKWVNDLFLHGRKISGSLTATQVQGDIVERAVFGIGINVAQAPVIERSPLVSAAGSLAEYDLSLPTLFTALVNALDEGVKTLHQQGPPAIFEQYRARADFIERVVNIWPEHTEPNSGSEPILQGRVLDLLPDLSLIIEGQREPVRKGRMTYVD